MLRALMESGEIASVYTRNENPDNFYIGYVSHMSQQHFAMRMLDIDGAHDGWLVGRNADIVQVIAGDDYEVRIKWLETLLDGEIPPDPVGSQAGSNLFADYAEAARMQRRVITLWTEDAEEEIIGYVRSVDDLHIMLDTLDFFGQDADAQAVGLSQIELMSIDAPEERMFMRMHENISPMSPLTLL